MEQQVSGCRHSAMSAAFELFEGMELGGGPAKSRSQASEPIPATSVS
jgi:hypothetical protein